MTRLTGAEMFADLFAGYQVSHVFFVPTVLNHALYQMEKRTGVNRIVTHSEKAAAYMADGYARVSGRPGVCLAQTVGAANLAAGLRDAFMGCSLVIAITGTPYRHSRGRHTEMWQFADVNFAAIARDIGADAVRIERPRDLPGALKNAFAAERPTVVEVVTDINAVAPKAFTPR